MATPQTVAFHTLGCKLNFSETSTIRRRFEDLGYTSVNWDNPSDIYVLNTCSVTEFADKKCRAEVRKVLRLNEEAKVVVIGCYAQLKPQEIAAIPGVDLVLGAAEKFNVQQYIDGLSKAPDKGMIKAGEVSEVSFFEEAYSFGDRTRTFLKVQDGCDYKCSFCTIPQARGKSRSASIEQLVSSANQIAEQGVKEIVLTGVNIGDYGITPEGVRDTRFIDLLKELEQVAGIQRYRISSIEPNLCSDDIIEHVAQSQKVVPHFHMPLQSGSDRILSLMKRRYKRGLYQERVAKIKELMPHCCIGVDVIVANTTALDLEEVVPMQVRRARNKVLRELSQQKRAQFYQEHAGTVRPVLLEGDDNDGYLHGFTDNYVKISLPYQEDLKHTIQHVQIGEMLGSACKSSLATTHPLEA